MSGGLGRFRVRCCAPIAMTGIAAWLPLMLFVPVATMMAHALRT